MKEVSIEEILDKYNLIVPEIQREYVWGFNQYGIFETFLKDIKDGRDGSGELTPAARAIQEILRKQGVDEAVRAMLLKALPDSPQALNIGFLYSYRPSYYIGNDREEDLYLIDGQQRFTTLFLILFYFSLKERRKPDFLQLFKFDEAREKIAFDYRVRSVTHQFMIQLISKCNSVEDLLNIDNQSWFLQNFANDTTIMSICGKKGEKGEKNEKNKKDEKKGVFHLMNKLFATDEQPYFDYISKEVKFWHFKTEETSQGEELYITMNSRGQQLADNESVRAQLFDNKAVKDKPLAWSEKWEVWQDFFWKHRCRTKANENADDGFNEFLRWCQLLCMYRQLFKNGSADADKQNEFTEVLKWGSGAKLDIAYLSLEEIENTFDILKHLYEKFPADADLRSKYPKSNGSFPSVEQWISRDEKQLGQIDLFQLLPALQFGKHFSADQIPHHTLLRLMRITSSLSKMENVSKSVGSLISEMLYFADVAAAENDVMAVLNRTDISVSLLNVELTHKLCVMAKSADRQQLEDLLWYAEELEINKGEVAHLINLAVKNEKETTAIDIELLKQVIGVFEELTEKADEIMGELLPTDCYEDQADRIVYDKNWHKKAGFLSIVESRSSNRDMELGEFIAGRQKEFIRTYEAMEAMRTEKMPAKQLYILYILSSNDIPQEGLEWNWNYYYNFGKSNANENYSSPFEHGSIFQQYRNAFRENESRILSIHQIDDEQIFEKLFDWSAG